MAEGEETKMCSTCEKDIPVSKFRMHEIGCARNNYKCRECGEVVAKAEREEHEETAHKPVTCQYCPFTAPSAQFGQHEERCDMKPRACRWCEQVFKIDAWVVHEEQCGTKTNQCGDCEQYIQRKHWDEHAGSDECRIFKDEARRKAELEQQKRLEELEKFRREEEEQKRKMAEKRERREREQAEVAQRAQREQEAMKRMMQQPRGQRVASGARAASGSRQNPSLGIVASSAAARGSAQGTRPVIQNNRKPVVASQRVPKPSSGAAREQIGGMSINASQPARAGALGAGKTAMMNSRLSAAGQNVVQKPLVGPNKVVTGSAARKPSSMMPASGSRHQPPPRAQPQAAAPQMDADMLAIAAALDEEESLAMAQKLQEEAYMGGNLSARGGGGAAQSMDQRQMMPQAQAMGYDDQGIPAARPQIMDQLIGGGDDEPMVVDEYSSSANVPRDNLGAGARDNFPSGFQESRWGQAAAGGGAGGGPNLGGTASNAELERALAASMEDYQARAAVSNYDEDAQLAAILEASKNDR